MEKQRKMRSGKLERSHLLCFQIKEGPLPGENLLGSVKANIADEEHITGVGIILRVVAIDAVVAVMDLDVVFSDSNPALEASGSIGGD